MNKFDLGWLCGILDADGTFTRDNKSIRIAVKMTDLDTVQKVAELMNTNVNGPYDPGPGALGTKEVYIAYVAGRKARSLMQSIKRYMSLRRQSQIEILLGGQNELFEFPRSL